ncbi:MAG: phospho-N-acetylmuramoyl-pentapeptide-transferase [candidate division WOR-3 bacterium]
MLYHLLYPLKEYFGPLNLFRYITFRAAYAGALSLLLCLILGPWVIRKIKKMAIGQNIRDEVPKQHQIKAGTPTMGGILMLVAILIATLLFADLTNRHILLGCFIIVAYGLLGYADDYLKVKKMRARGLKKRVKLFFQIFFALIVGLILYYYPMQSEIKTVTNVIFLKNFQIDFRLFYIPFVIFVMTLTSNAVNLADGLDGLSAGLLGISAAGYAVLAYVSGHAKIAEYLNILFVPSAGEMTIFCFAVLGACLGFLWFNTFPAQVFMGDTGSLPLGAIIGFAAIVTKHEFLLLFIGGVFIIEALTVFLQVIYFHLTKGKRIFRMAPLHHHFELCGWPEPKIVVRFWIIGILLAILAVSTLKIR